MAGLVRHGRPIRSPGGNVSEAPGSLFPGKWRRRTTRARPDAFVRVGRLALPAGNDGRHPPPRPRVLIANEKRERPELLAQVVIGLDVIGREIYVREVDPSPPGNTPTTPSSGSAQARNTRSRSFPRSSVTPRARSSRSCTHPTPRSSARLRNAGCSPASSKQPRRVPKRDRRHPPTLPRVQEPPGGVRATRPDRTSEREPHGTPTSTAAASSATSPQPSTATSYSSRLARRTPPLDLG